MSALVLKWRRPAPAISTRWRGPSADTFAQAAVDPEAVAAVIGPPGGPGPAGPPGPPIDNYDPGDITLDFDNALI